MYESQSYSYYTISLIISSLLVNTSLLLSLIYIKLRSKIYTNIITNLFLLTYATITIISTKSTYTYIIAISLDA
jgi:hypothetical protein